MAKSKAEPEPIIPEAVQAAQPIAPLTAIVPEGMPEPAVFNPADPDRQSVLRFAGWPEDGTTPVDLEPRVRRIRKIITDDTLQLGLVGLSLAERLAKINAALVKVTQDRSVTRAEMYDRIGFNRATRIFEKLRNPPAGLPANVANQLTEFLRLLDTGGGFNFNRQVGKDFVASLVANNVLTQALATDLLDSGTKDISLAEDAGLGSVSMEDVERAR